MASATEELNLTSSFFLVNGNINNHTWPAATILGSTAQHKLKHMAI